MKKKEKLVRLVMFALFMALIVIFTFTPYLGYITLGASISITTLHIVVILGAAILKKPYYGAALGFIWGMLCLIKAFMEPIIANVPFQNPLVSVLPRVVVGLVASLLIGVLLNTKLPTAVSVGIGSLVATLTNTVLVISALTVFNGFDTLLAGIKTSLTTIITVLIGVNGIIETVAAVILVPAIYIATEKFFKKQTK